MAIRERLAAADPDNAGGQRDLARNFGRVAEIEGLNGERASALSRLHQGRKIIVQLLTKSPDNARLPDDLATFDEQIAKLENDQNT